MINISKKLGDIAIKHKEKLDNVVETYRQYYRKYKSKEREEPMTLEYSRKILRMTRKYYKLLGGKNEK